MPKNTTNRQQRSRRQARAAAAAAARRRRARTRVAVIAAVGVALLVALLVIVLGGDDDGEEAGTTSTSSSGEAGCVAPDASPEGAPEVAVEEGPPPTELVTEDLRVGDGADVVEGATVTVNYIGVACSTGAIFDESYTRQQPATFPLGQVIPGWQQGIPGMKVGGQRLLGIPSDLAYGAAGRPRQIGPNEALWFVVEVLDTQPPGS